MWSTVFMINIPVAAILYVTFEEIFIEKFNDDEIYIWTGLAIFLAYLAFATNYNMIKTAMIDPGILPARRWPLHVAAKYDEPPPDKPAKWESVKHRHDHYYTSAWFVNQRNSPHLY